MHSPHSGTKIMLGGTFSANHFENIGQALYNQGIFDWTGEPMSQTADFYAINKAKEEATLLFTKKADPVFHMKCKRFNFPHFHAIGSPYEWMLES